MTLSAKRVLRWLIGMVLIVASLAILGVEVWHQHALSVVTAGVAVSLGTFGGLLVAPHETKANVSTILGWVREVVRGKSDAAR